MYKVSTTGWNWTTLHVFNQAKVVVGESTLMCLGWTKVEVELASMTNWLWRMVCRGNYRYQTYANYSWWKLNWLHFVLWVAWSPVIMSPVEESKMGHRCNLKDNEGNIITGENSSMVSFARSIRVSTGSSSTSVGCEEIFSYSRTNLATTSGLVSFNSGWAVDLQQLFALACQQLQSRQGLEALNLCQLLLPWNQHQQK